MCSAPLTLSDWRLRPGQWTPLTNALFTSPASAALNCPRPVIVSGACGSAQAAGALSQHLPWSLVTGNIFFAGLTSYRQGAVVDVPNSGGGHCRKSRQQPPGSPLSTSSTSVVAVVGSAVSTPQGSTVDVFNNGGGRCRTCRQQPLGGLPSTSSISVVAAAENPDSTP
jgi:hypothetical protein